jgi:hypothetical protein
MNQHQLYRINQARPNERVTLTADAGVPEIMAGLLAVDRQPVHYDVLEFCQLAIGEEKGINALYAIFDTVRDRVQYKRDAAFEEVIQSPRRLLQTGKGDCKSLSLLVGACLACCGVRYFYRLVWNENPDQAHVFPVAIWPPGSNDSIFMDVALGRWNEEPAYLVKKDYTT